LVNGPDGLLGRDSKAVHPFAGLALELVWRALSWASGDMIVGAAITALGNGEEDSVKGVAAAALSVGYVEIQSCACHWEMVWIVFFAERYAR
jgi:hypothetical protein